MRQIQKATHPPRPRCRANPLHGQAEAQVGRHVAQGHQLGPLPQPLFYGLHLSIGVVNQRHPDHLNPMHIPQVQGRQKQGRLLVRTDRDLVPSRPVHSPHDRLKPLADPPHQRQFPSRHPKKPCELVHRRLAPRILLGWIDDVQRPPPHRLFRPPRVLGDHRLRRDTHPPILEPSVLG